MVLAVYNIILQVLYIVIGGRDFTINDGLFSVMEPLHYLALGAHFQAVVTLVQVVVVVKLPILIYFGIQAIVSVLQKPRLLVYGEIVEAQQIKPMVAVQVN
jgi:hypothetical protein